MDPILGAIVLVLILRRLTVDTAYAVRGKTPPSYRLRMAKLEAQGKTQAKAAGPARYGSRDYLRDLWLDAVEDARDARVAKRAEAKARTAETTGDASDPREVDRGSGSNGEKPATEPATESEPTTGPVTEPPAGGKVAVPDLPELRPGTDVGKDDAGKDDAGQDQDAEKKGPAADQAPVPAATAPAPAGGPVTVPDLPQLTPAADAGEKAGAAAAPTGERASSRPVPTPATTGAGEGTVLPGKVSAASVTPPGVCHICRLNPGTQQGDAVICGPCSNSIKAELDGRPTGRYRLWRGTSTFEVDHVNPGDPAAAQPRPDLALVPDQSVPGDPQTPAAPSSPEPATATPPMATVTPLHRTQEDNDMTNSTVQSGEITGLESAKAYAAEMAATYAANDSSVEEFTASLEGFGVSGEAIAAAAQAAEAQQVAQAAWQQAHAALAAQDTVKEAYEATPGAGSREFVTSE